MKTIIFFGGGVLLSELIKISLNKKINCVVFTSPRHAKETILKNLTFKNFLKSKKINFYITRKINIKKLKKYTINKKCIGFSIGSAWIFKKNIIDIFKSRIYNIHGANLPSDRGGGGFSWQILKNNKNGFSCLHKINEKIDYGNIIETSKFSSRSFNNPIDWQKKYIKVSADMFKKNLSNLFTRKIISKKQSKTHSTYWPRLDTEIHGWINWSWSGNDIVNFIKAFGDPYAGAHTLLNNEKIYLKNCKFKKIQKFHPFQFGIITNKTKNSIAVIVKDGIIKIKNVYEKNGKKKKFRKLKVGDRLFSPNKKLNAALTKRVYFNL